MPARSHVRGLATDVSEPVYTASSQKSWLSNACSQGHDTDCGESGHTLHELHEAVKKQYTQLDATILHFALTAAGGASEYEEPDCNARRDVATRTALKTFGQAQAIAYVCHSLVEILVLHASIVRYGIASIVGHGIDCCPLSFKIADFLTFARVLVVRMHGTQ